MNKRIRKNSSIRLDKFLSGRGVCSRRDVASYIINHIVMIGEIRALEPGIRLDPQKENVTVDGKSIDKKDFVYYVLNKPKGVISTSSDEFGRQNVISLIPENRRIYPVGRLDKETSGLLILTNDGELTNLLTHPRYHIDKTYILTIQGKVNKKQVLTLQNGVELSDGTTSLAKVTVLQTIGSKTTLEMTIHEGRNRQIRRMCERVGLNLLELERIRIGTLKIGNLKVGEYRKIGLKEVKKISDLTLIK